MDKRPLVKWYIANFGISLDVLSFSVLDNFFRLFFLIFFFGFCVFFVHPSVVSVLLSALVERFYVSRMRDFLLLLVLSLISAHIERFTGLYMGIFNSPVPNKLL